MSQSIKKFLTNPGLLFLALGHRGMFNWIPDDIYLRFAYRIRMGKKLNLDNPQTFNEKLQWLKLYDRKPEYTTMVDKYEAKQWVASRIGEEYIIPTLGIWDHFGEIDFEALPNQFVLKCTHDSGGLIICRNKATLDKVKAKKKLDQCLRNNYFWGMREWPYKNVKPRIIAEQYMEDSVTKDLRDYKIFTFDGVAKALFIATDRGAEGETKFDFFDADFKHLPFTNGHPNADIQPKKPETFEKMIELAAKLSKGIPEVRMDFYEVDGRTYFGEMTFSHWSGMVPFDPEKWDNIFGNWIKLPEPSGGGYCLISDGFVLWLHQSDDTVLTDYKFFCFNGYPRIMYVSKDKGEKPATDFFDMDFNRLDMRMKDPNSDKCPSKPDCFDTMRKCAETLSKGIPNLRVDFYIINGHPYIGELTFFHMSGFAHIHPGIWERKLGEWIVLP